ncbi:uncharacterized protein LOC107670028 [Sinocyclocheilus anshuiensis]|uniref:uncharacterized protein LOC107670028 n=1 Tax=Sinocyclocheilus anshuiensis TaxID=1608454 RepID=UPI0007B939A9|nr:PREDICTED: uncharacterized protein LOC107670028 [Sinocyclocheilus anshuiensis]
MAAVIEDAIEDAVEAFESYTAEGADLAEEVTEEMAEEIAEAKVEVQEISKESSVIKKCIVNVSTGIKDLGIFMAKNAAIGVILWGVNVTLAKLFPKGQGQSEKQKCALIKEVIQVIKTEICISKRMAKWLEDHKEETVILDGIEIPLESLISTHIKPVSDAIDQAYSVAQSLQNSDGNPYKVPTAGDIQKFLMAADAFLNAFNFLVAFINENMQKFQGLCSFPVKKEDIDTLRELIENVKAEKMNWS